MVEMKKERERAQSGSYTNISRRIYEEKTASRVDRTLGESSSRCLHNPLWVFTLSLLVPISAHVTKHAADLEEKAQR